VAPDERTADLAALVHRGLAALLALGAGRARRRRAAASLRQARYGIDPHASLETP